MNDIEKAIEYYKGMVFPSDMSERTLKAIRFNKLAIQALEEKVEREKNEPLTLEELKQMELLDWVWIEAIKPHNICEEISAYYRKSSDYTEGKAFCCGYPGIGYHFKYSEYGVSWLAYKRKLEVDE